MRQSYAEIVAEREDTTKSMHAKQDQYCAAKLIKIGGFNVRRANHLKNLVHLAEKSASLYMNLKNLFTSGLVLSNDKNFHIIANENSINNSKDCFQERTKFQSSLIITWFSGFKQ